MASLRRRQRTTLTFAVSFELPVGVSVEEARRRLLKLVSEVPDHKPDTVKVKLVNRNVDYTERGTTTPDS